MTASLTRNPQWRLQATDGMLLVSGGADELYVVDEASADVVPKILSAYESGACASLLTDPECGAAIRQLRRLGALVPDIIVKENASPRVVVRWWGKSFAGLDTALRDNGWHVCDESSEKGHADSAMVLFVRTNLSWQDVLRDYQANAPQRPHLLLDMAYHHTVSVGPLVVPEQTACISCFGHRVIRRWGDMPPPQQPAATKYMAVIGALLASTPDLHLTCLEQTVSLDLRSLTTTKSRVFQLPGCEVCGGWLGDSHLARGRLELPWTELKRS